VQFAAGTWKAHGGRTYANQADQATKAEQIAIARRVLAGQGPGAWPTCGRRAGLTKSNGKADRNATPVTNPGASKTTKVSDSKKKIAKKAAPKKYSANASSKTIHVKRGDTLRKIAKRYHVKGGWKALWKLNKKTIKNSNLIYIGQPIKIK
jgi:nucleoid-associated protein YgaU